MPAARQYSGESGRDLGGEARHLVLDLPVRFQPDIDVEDHLVEPGRLDLLQRVSDVRWGPEQYRILAQILRPHLLQPLDDLDEITVARRRGRGIAWEGRGGAFPIIPDLPRARRLFGRRRVGEMQEIAAHEPARLMAVLDAGFAIDIRHLLQPAKGQCRCEWRNNQISPEPP